MSAGTIVIDRLPLSIAAAASFSRAEGVMRRMRDGLARGLPSALEAACGQAFDGDQRHVFIDRLDVHCVVGSHWDDAAIGRAFAEKLTRALLSGAPEDGAIAFRDRAEYLAAFIAAVADGTAHARWWFEEFSGLAALPASAAIRTAAAEDAAVGVAALARLTRDTLARVLSCLSEGDARRLCEAVMHVSPVGRQATVVDVLTAWAEAAAAYPADGARALAALIALERGRSGAANRQSAAMIGAMAALRRSARNGRLAAFLRGSLPDAAALAACAAAAGVADPFPGLSEDDARIIVEDLRRFDRADGGIARAGERQSDTGAGSDAAVLYSPYGGALLLGALIARLNWWAEWPPSLALAVAARALGGPRAGAIVADDALRQAFGVTVVPGAAVHDVSPARLRRAIVRAVPRAARAAERSLDAGIRSAAVVLLREFARRMPGCEGATARYLRRQCLAGGAAVTIHDGRVDARLGRAPLDVLLRLSGLHRVEVALPDGRTWSLHVEDHA